MKQRLIATAVIILAWFGLDMLFHNVILMNDYASTAYLWRPMAEMKMIHMNLAKLLTALSFVLIYCQMIPGKTLQKGIKLGVLVGLVVGFGMSLGSYSYMPISSKIAIVWFLSSLANYTVAGAITGYFVKTELNG